MAFKSVLDLDADITVSLGGTNRKTGKKNPESVEGYYIGSRKHDSPKAKSGFSYLHIFKTEKDNVGVWGKTDMDRKILAISPGTMARVTFTGMQPTKNGDMYKFRAEVDEDNTIDVGGLANEPSYQDPLDEAENVESNDESEDEPGTAYSNYEAPTAAPAQVLAPRKNSLKEVQALLAKNKAK